MKVTQSLGVPFLVPLTVASNTQAHGNGWKFSAKIRKKYPLNVPILGQIKFIAAKANGA